LPEGRLHKAANPSYPSGTVFVLKGNRPLELRWHPRRKAVLYASDPAYLDAVLAEEKGWREIAVPPMSLVVFRRENLSGYSVEPFEFVAQERKGAEPWQTLQ